AACRAPYVAYEHRDRGREMPLKTQVGGGRAVARGFGRTAWVVLLAFAATQPAWSQTARKGWDSMEFRKPSDPQLRQSLTPPQYDVTQHGATDPRSHNESLDNHRAGLYVALW